MSSDAKICAPCSGLDESSLLTLEEVKKELESLPLWCLEERGGIPCLLRHYVCKNFQAALDSINAVGAIAERESHHPDLHLDKYREVEIVLWTHKLGGITTNDLKLAKVLDDEVEVSYSPKWLKEHPEAARMVEDTESRNLLSSEAASSEPSMCDIRNLPWLNP